MPIFSIKQHHALAPSGGLTIPLRVCRVVWMLCMVLVIAACATTAKTPQQEPATAERARQQAEAAYLAKDYQQVSQILGPLAEQGDAAAQYIIGYMYYYGQGVTANLELAQEWIGRAAAQGHSKARVALDQLKQTTQDPAPQKPLHVETVSEPPPEAKPPAIEVSDPPSVPLPAEQVLAAEPEPTKLEPVKPEPTEPEPAKPEAVDSTSAQAMQPPPWAKPAETEMSPAWQIRSGKWVMARPATNYTIQLLATHDEKAVIEFIKRHNITAEAGYYAFTRKGEAWFAVVYGSFDSLSQAKSALEGLDADLRKKSPWIRAFGDIQKIAR